MVFKSSINSGGGSGGGVTDVSGTTNRITSTGGTAPAIDISGSYSGQSSITILGTLTAGASGAGFTLNFGTSTLTGSIPYNNGGLANVRGIANQIPQVNPAADGFVFNYALNQSVQTVDSPAFYGLTVGATSAITGVVNFKGTTSGIVTLSPQDVAGTWTFKLPANAGSNTNVLQTDGSGNTSWVPTINLATPNLWTGQQNFPAVLITSTASHISWNLNVAQSAKHIATQNTTLDNPTNMVDGGTYIFRWIQNSSSAKTLGFGNAYKWPGGTPPVVTVATTGVDVFTFVCTGSAMLGVAQLKFL